MADKLNSIRTANSLAITAGIVSVVCALLILLAPEFTVSLFGAIFHGIDLSQISATATIGSSLLGVIEVVILGWIVGWLFAKIYNALGN